MAAISASLVKELRDKTGAGMMDCKKALVEADGDMEKAVDNLRKAGIAKAEKKSGRAVKEGKIYAHVNGDKGVLVEVLCETDFVAKTENFQNYMTELAGRIVELDGDGDVSEKVQEMESKTLVPLIATIGENIQIRRVACWKATGKLDSYLHMAGRIGVMIDVVGDADRELLHDICMHIAAFKPVFVSPEEIPADVLEKEKQIAAAQVQGKPENIIEKIVLGKINKWYTETCLMKQPWIRDDKTCLAKVNPNITIKRFLRWEIGEEL